MFEAGSLAYGELFDMVASTLRYDPEIGCNVDILDPDKVFEWQIRREAFMSRWRIDFRDFMALYLVVESEVEDTRIRLEGEEIL